jgi:alkylated DNA repair dioxygenase AlkB
MKENLSGFECHDLGGGGKFWVGQLPDALMPNSAEFDALWQLHPAEFHEIKMHGRLVKTPRWQQAYGMDYHYTGRVNKALPMPSLLEPFLRWTRENIDDAFNGLLLNWYDGQRGHYIGRHRDSIQNMIPGVLIATISLGEERTFRLRPWPARPETTPIDFPARNGMVFVMPWETNRAFTHEVPASTRKTVRRISVTLRGFVSVKPG